EQYILSGRSSIVEGKSESESSVSTDSSFTEKDGNIKAALLQLVPEEAYYLIDDKPTSKEMWDSLNEYFKPQQNISIDKLLEEFWSFSMEEGTDIDKFAQELIKLQSRISSVDKSHRPSDAIMKSRLLNHFDNYRDGYYSGAVTVLRNDVLTSFSQTIDSLRTTQSSYKRHHPEHIVSLVTEGKDQESSKAKVKKCAHCNRSGHIREACFHWIETPDGTKWAAKNPEKAAKVR
ncbi:hypothetical protein K3495_g16688, partial [Podosphaera aphanis]